MKAIKYLENKKKESDDAWSYDEIKEGTELDDHSLLQQLLFGMLMKVLDGTYVTEGSIMVAYFRCT